MPPNGCGGRAPLLPNMECRTSPPSATLVPVGRSAFALSEPAGGAARCVARQTIPILVRDGSVDAKELGSVAPTKTQFVGRKRNREPSVARRWVPPEAMALESGLPITHRTERLPVGIEAHGINKRSLPIGQLRDAG